MGQWFRWIVYAVCIFIVAIAVFRLISTADPKELKNYIIESEKIEKAYTDLKEDFKIYRIDIRDSFSMGDALFVNNLYYLESVENLQITLRCKNSRFQDLLGSFNKANSIHPFKTYLKVSADIADIADGNDKNDETKESTESEDEISQDYIILEPVNESAFSKDTDRYRYFVYSFDSVQINYAKTKVELYVFENSPDSVALFDEEEYLARFTLFDVNMPKTRIQAKKFKLD